MFHVERVRELFPENGKERLEPLCLRFPAEEAPCHLFQKALLFREIHEVHLLVRIALGRDCDPSPVGGGSDEHPPAVIQFKGVGDAP